MVESEHPFPVESWKVPGQMQSHGTGHFVQYQPGHQYPFCRGIFHAADHRLSPLSQTKALQHANHRQQQNKQRYIGCW